MSKRKSEQVSNDEQSAIDSMADAMLGGFVEKPKPKPMGQGRFDFDGYERGYGRQARGHQPYYPGMYDGWEEDRRSGGSGLYSDMKRSGVTERRTSILPTTDRRTIGENHGTHGRYGSSHGFGQVPGYQLRQIYRPLRVEDLDEVSVEVIVRRMAGAFMDYLEKEHDMLFVGAAESLLFGDMVKAKIAKSVRETLGEIIDRDLMRSPSRLHEGRQNPYARESGGE